MTGNFERFTQHVAGHGASKEYLGAGSPGFVAPDFTCPIAQLTGSVVCIKLLVQRPENPMLQNVSKVRPYLAKDEAHARWLGIEASKYSPEL